MCIIFIVKNVHPDYPLVVAANRDEFFARPTQAPHWWDDAPHLFAGKDLQAGGTWLGHNRLNRIAGITNLRRTDLYQAGAKSRGDLVKGFLDLEAESTDAAIEFFSTFLEAEYQQYNPFNLVYGDASDLRVFSSADGVVQSLGDGVHSLSNGVPQSIWPKMRRGIDALSNQFANGEFEASEIFKVLEDQIPADDKDLTDTGLTTNEERQLSSVFVPKVQLRGQPYGTRSSSIIWHHRAQGKDSLEMQSKIIA